MVTTVKFQATSCFHRVLWQITIFLVVKLSKNRESCCQGYVLCKDIFVTSRSTRGPISPGPISLGPLFSPKLRGGCIRALSQYASRGNASTAARKYVALAVCHRSRPLRAACGLLLSPARAFTNRVIQPQAACFYRHPLWVRTCLTWVRRLLRIEHLGGFWPVMISKKKRPPFGQPLFSNSPAQRFIRRAKLLFLVLVLLTALVPVLAPALASGPRSTGLFKPTP